MYSTVIVFQCLFLFQATMADSTMDLLKLSVSNQVLVLNSQIKDLKTLVEHQNTKLEHQNTQFAKENLKFLEENAKLAKLETKIGNMESEITRLTHSEVTTTTPPLTTTSSTTTTTATTKTAPLTTMGPTEPSTTKTAPFTTMGPTIPTTTKTAPFTTMGPTIPLPTTPFSVGIKDQALLLHIKDQDIKISELKVLVEHQNTKLEHQNTQIAELKVLVEHQNTKFEKENVKFAEVKTKMYKLESEIGQLTNSQATTTSSPSTSSTSSTSSIDTSSGVVFTRWGRRDCPAGISTPVYNGTVGGSSRYDTGAAVNRLCMPNQPTWDNNKLFKPKYSGYVYSGVYSSYLPDSSLFGVAPCAVCRAELFSTKVMIPGRDTCYPGWTQAYAGELVSGHRSHQAATEYTCLDKQLQVAGSGGNTKFWLFPVSAKCGFSYPDDALLTCVVCLK